MARVRRLRVAGTPYEMGYQHGRAYADEIALLTEERVRLSGDPFWTGGRAVSHAEVLALGEACLAAHEAFVPELMDEIRGMADATGLGVNELVIMNGFTDFVDVVANPDAVQSSALQVAGEIGDGDGGGCTAFVVDPSAAGDGNGYVGQTWDMHSSATPHVLMLDVQPSTQSGGGPALMTFTITGCVGMIGMNEHGVAVGINNLVTRTGRVGVHWVFVIRKMLAQPTVDDALIVLRSAPLSGAHNFTLMGPDGTGELRGYNVEHMATRYQVTPVTNVTAHTNHCLLPEMEALQRERKAYSLASTHARFDQADHILHQQAGQITIDTLINLTRHHAADCPSVCAHAVPDYDVESSGACIMSPSTRQLWAVWGNPCNNEYAQYCVMRTA